MEKEKDMLSMKDLAINGHDLIQLGFQGKAIGDVLKAVYEWVLEEPSRNEKDILERYIETEFLTRL
jgi:tRNA nucleotidyltransferase (CCA-adding enzyme)